MEDCVVDSHGVDVPAFGYKMTPKMLVGMIEELDHTRKRLGQPPLEGVIGVGSKYDTWAKTRQCCDVVNDYDKEQPKPAILTISSDQVDVCFLCFSMYISVKACSTAARKLAHR